MPRGDGSRIELRYGRGLEKNWRPSAFAALKDGVHSRTQAFSAVPRTSLWAGDIEHSTYVAP